MYLKLVFFAPIKLYIHFTRSCCSVNCYLILRAIHDELMTHYCTPRFVTNRKMAFANHHMRYKVDIIQRNIDVFTIVSKWYNACAFFL
jgi:hypothetical protein